MKRSELVYSYFERLLSADNQRDELEIIRAELDGLVFTESNKPIDKATKVKILEELEDLLKSTPSLEDLSESASYPKSESTASDNSDVLAVIKAMKAKAKQ
ncbi:hypothetical protein [Stenotrophomonas sp. 57]|uniref:hypothetical protein n=1 Tax=Stenotrophomonas sp. 57 TaxID=3051119 RepID=UPI00256EA3A8|nr:hypothetical protein [Stenotrophomonas sp. 57]